MATTDITNGAERSADELREENEQLRSTVERFDQRLERLETVISSNGDGASAVEHASDDTAPPADDERLDRRGALRKLGQAAAAGAGLFVAGSAVKPQIARAADGDPVNIGVINSSSTGTRTLVNSSADSSSELGGAALVGYNESGTGSSGRSVGLTGWARAGSSVTPNIRGVHGESRYGIGVSGQSDEYVGVQGSSGVRHGVSGHTDATSQSWAGVHGHANPGASILDGTAVRGYIEGGDTSDAGVGVRGEGHYGVYGRGKRYGVHGNGDEAGVSGHSSSGIGVRARSNSFSDPAIRAYTDYDKGVSAFGGDAGVYAESSSNGYPLQLAATGLAQMQIAPMTTSGPPTSDSHDKGEIFVDADGILWTCTASGTPGTWTKVHTSGFSSFTTFPTGWPVEAMSTKADNNEPAENTGNKLDSGRDGNYTVDVSGHVPPNTTGVLLSLTAQDPEGLGFLGIWPEGTWPGNANLNYQANENITTLAAVSLASDSTFQLRTRDGRPTHVIVSLVAAIVTE